MLARSNSSYSNILLAMVLLAFTLAGLSCTDESPQPPSAASATAKKAGPKQAAKDTEKKDTAEPNNDYTYNPSGKVDPFVPLITNAPGSEAPTAAKKENKEVPLSPLQKLDIDDFTLSAVIMSDKGVKALLEDPAMNGFIVREGLLIGKNEGVIKKILPNSIIVEEYDTDSLGNREKKIKTITLKKNK